METTNQTAPETQALPKNMKRCKSCGEVLAKNARTCPKCGYRYKKPIFLRVWFLIIVIPVAIFLFASFKHSADEKAYLENGGGRVWTIEKDGYEELTSLISAAKYNQGDFIAANLQITRIDNTYLEDNYASYEYDGRHYSVIRVLLDGCNISGLGKGDRITVLGQITGYNDGTGTIYMDANSIYEGWEFVTESATK